MRMFRQGDVLVVQIKNLPAKELKPIERENGKIVLAHGEVTGHTHAIAEPTTEFLTDGQSRFLNVIKTSLLKHEEHYKIELPKGVYRVIQQREYRPEGVRNVAD